MKPVLPTLYGHSLALLTDLYQLTMAYGYWKSGVAGRRAAFHLFFRKNPYGGGYSVACGLQSAIEYIENFRFTPDDVEYLASIPGNDGKPLFEADFLDHLANMRFECDVDAMPEGTLAFAHEPMLRISGPILQCQLLETPLLNTINFATLIATKSARICHAAQDEPVLEFGLRRAQGSDGALSAARAAYIGGCAATSNVLAGKLFGIPVRGTHAHSWVMFFADEIEAFDTYAQAMPNNCVFLVDTYDTLEGVRRAIQIGEKLRQRGHEMAGVRLDSGDLAHLSIEARKLLDDAGFPDAAVVASNDLDERIIDSLKKQGATIGVWGVGTKLITAYEQPALGGVYKLAAVEDGDDGWEFKIKLSEQNIKISNPGLLQVRRFSRTESPEPAAGAAPGDGRNFVADVIYCQEQGFADSSARAAMVDINDPTRARFIGEHDGHDDLLVPIYRAGERVYDCPDLDTIRQRTRDQLGRIDPRTKRFLNPQPYPVGLESALSARKQAMIARARGLAGEPLGVHPGAITGAGRTGGDGS